MNKLHECCSCHKFLPNTYKLNSGEFICEKCLNKMGVAQRKISDIIVNLLKDEEITQPEWQVIILEDVINTIKYDNDILEKNKIRKMEKIAKKMEKSFNEK